MFKRTYKNINLSCIMQQDSENSKEKCLNGVMSKTKDGFLFEQSVRKGWLQAKPETVRRRLLQPCASARREVQDPHEDHRCFHDNQLPVVCLLPVL